MNKNISVERLYSLGDYRNIKFSDTISDIPQEVALNPKLMQLLNYLQIVDIELNFTRYKELVATAGTQHAEDTLAFLETERNVTFEQLINELSSDILKE